MPGKAIAAKSLFYRGIHLVTTKTYTGSQSGFDSFLRAVKFLSHFSNNLSNDPQRCPPPSGMNDRDNFFLRMKKENRQTVSRENSDGNLGDASDEGISFFFPKVYCLLPGLPENRDSIPMDLLQGNERKGFSLIANLLPFPILPRKFISRVAFRPKAMEDFSLLFPSSDF
jgi:hypothetical protein